MTWTPPTLNTDGTAVTNIIGYRIFYGTNPSGLSLSFDVSGSTTTSYVITGLSAGTYYFSVAAVNSLGVSSVGSNVVSKSVQ